MELLSLFWTHSSCDSCLYILQNHLLLFLLHFRCGLL
nr:MAG TPA: hypothetical protein [Caudoviricetes sp.]